MFTIETFLRPVNLLLLHGELFVLVSCCIGMMLFPIEFSIHSSMDFLS